MRYRITYDNLADKGLTVVEIEAGTLVQAAFEAGVRAVHETDAEPGELALTKVEVPAGWIEVSLS